VQRYQERDLEILTAIGEGRHLTQRALAQRLGVALGLTNLYLKRLAKQGFIKIVGFPRKPAARKRLRYLLTPKGIAEKTRLTYEHVAYSLNLYRRARQTLREALSHLPGNGMKRIALYGTGEAAELAYLTLKESGLEPIGVFSGDGGGYFLAFPVRPVTELVGSALDCLVVATFEQPEPHVDHLRSWGVPGEKIVTLRGLTSPIGGAREAGG